MIYNYVPVKAGYATNSALVKLPGLRYRLRTNRRCQAGGPPPITAGLLSEHNVRVCTCLLIRSGNCHAGGRQ